MYTITRGPSKLATQRRTGPTQQLDSKTSDFKHKQTSWNMPDLPAPKIVFKSLNGKKHHPAPALPPDSRQESFSPLHEENVRFISSAWQEVIQQQEGMEVSQRAVHYKETTPATHMDSFVPLDLDECWAQRFLANIDKLS
ncbi:hypothetical protein OJAV_G00078720 [Oryzias javanicus]|uniref:MAPK regulated corepressor interacting protein 2 n=1 Tax=Oryzias javanicus TaxID=123683 RepID=A0A437D422_ORYJA|nr:hypothetical protein OJAV_G00078720 [Oryzias javanicus]